MKGMVTPLRLRSLGEDAGRKVTWLELFFDLIFVAAVSQVAEPLREHYTLEGLIRFAPLFALIWWAWIGHTVFSTRFDTDDAMQRGLTLVQMFVVAVMAANAKDALDSRASAGFAAAYAALRFLLVAQYLRASTLPEARPLTLRYLIGHGAAAVLWMTSALVPAPERFWIWGLAFAIDLGTPWLAIRHSVAIPPDAAHLPERFGLFTLILLGEAVIAVMQGMESQEDWSPAAATSAFLGMAISFLIWWWYFDGAAGGSEQPVRTTREALRFHIWTYAHFAVARHRDRRRWGSAHSNRGVSHGADGDRQCPSRVGDHCGHAVADADRRCLHWPPRRLSRSVLVWNLFITAVTVILGVAARITTPVLMIVTMATLCAWQLLVSLPEGSMLAVQARQPATPGQSANARREG
ncbi:MAG: low temperature requirement protein A [Vicinamibacterales bacterium]